MLSLPSGPEYRDVAVRSGGACEPAHQRQQDRPASAEAPPATRPLMRTSPHLSISIYLSQTFSVFPLLIDNETVTSIDKDAERSIDFAVYMSIDPRDKGNAFFSLV
ncbi:hypothetical protein F2Q70_00026263 [Brassica cretica]|uniref:Uncharacterized protein n=1 Tax=Brassica cretica TaxID=69181 RepID=A0A8S9L314_BRACR|nr:hypothetical protein F2Q70_00026263 [Brassica cretica]